MQCITLTVTLHQAYSEAGQAQMRAPVRNVFAHHFIKINVKSPVSADYLLKGSPATTTLEQSSMFAICCQSLWLGR